MKKPIYLDYNATTPIAEEVAEAMKPYLTEFFGNPSSSHYYGYQTKKAIEKARQQIADLINASPDEIIFTSGGTESNNFAIVGSALANKNKGNHIITSKIEHPAVLEVCDYLKSIGYEISYINVDKYGIIDINELQNKITSRTILITVMHANNETGSIQPIEEISKIAKTHNITFHSDAAQSIGKIDVDVKKLGVDLLSIAGHKFYAPKGIGALYIKRGTNIKKILYGANHERNLRPGTENVLEIVGIGKAAEIAKRDLKKNYKHLIELRDLLFSNPKKELPDIKLNGHPKKRLPNTLNISFPGIEANKIISRLDNVAVSAGAACHSENVTVSSVLQAMKIPTTISMGTIRFSCGKYTTTKEIEIVSKEIIKTIKSLGSVKKSENRAREKIKLTKYTTGGGCACKIVPQVLEKALSVIKPMFNENVIIGTETSDDAAVYKLPNGQLLVQTVDFFTPIVDDPYMFGAISAANSLSDIYAMGAKPIFALNIVGFPYKTLPTWVLQEILRGAQDKANEAGIPILGGHSVEDQEPKFGLVVSGIVKENQLLSNSNAQVGDIIILTKALGTGILANAHIKGVLEEELLVVMQNSMATLNKTAGEIALKYKVNACTDVTGFGLLGHLKEVVEGSKVTAEIHSTAVAHFPKVLDYIRRGFLPGGTKTNANFIKDVVSWQNSVSEEYKTLLVDAQTSGGLLISVNQSDAENILKDLHQNGLKDSKIIGKIIEKSSGKIIVK